MKITTNYSKHDWVRFIPSMSIQLLPSIFFALAVVWLYIPFLDNWVIWMDFNAEEETIQKFAEYISSNQIMNSQDEFVSFMFLTLFGGALFPIILIVIFYKIIPTETIIKKLKIEPMMKLVIFNNGEPIRKFRDLLR